MNQLGLSPSKRWSQNFLINPLARNRIIDFILGSGEKYGVWEIGPGLGCITEQLLHRASWLTIFEIDPHFCCWLQSSFMEAARSIPCRLKIVEGDFCKTFKTEWEILKPDLVVGNLPYNSASRIISLLVENFHLPRRCVFTVQDEMAQRMMACPGSYHYSSFSVLCQGRTIIKDGGYLPAGFFYPRPRVNSRIVIMERNPDSSISQRRFGKFVRSMFTHRRKTLRNNLNAIDNNTQLPSRQEIEQAFIKENVNLDLRPQALEPEKWLAIFSHLNYPIAASVSNR